jgi:UDP-N-acetylglucosamine acyltransferase
MHSIHPTATVSKDCILEDGVEIGPYCALVGPLRLERGVKLLGHVYLSGPLTVGENTMLYPFSCVGFPGQDLKFKIGDKTAGVVIGKNSVLREHATVHAATNAEKPTRVGDSVLMMCGSHVGHDAAVANRAILVNGAAMGGHATLGEAATISAHVGVHQHGRIGRLAFVSANRITTDVPPFCLVAARNRLAGLNLVGLRRSGMPREHITSLRDAFRDVFRHFRTREEMLKILEERGRTCPPVAEWHQFVLDKNRAICPGHVRRSPAALMEDDADEVSIA